MKYLLPGCIYTTSTQNSMSRDKNAFCSETVVLLLFVCCTCSVNVSQVAIYFSHLHQLHGYVYQHMCELCTVWPSSYSASDTLPLQHTPYEL